MEKAYIRELAQKYVEGIATEKELDTLHQWYDEQKVDEEEIIVTSFPDAPEALKTRIYERILDEINEGEQHHAMVRPIRSAKRWYWAAAATVAGLMIGGYFFFQKPAEQGADLAVEQRFKNDIAPGGNKAILTLSGGKEIVLDTLANGTILLEGGATIEKTAEGQLVYRAGTGGSATAINTISTPIGGEYAVVLPDGSKVWLNAVSSLSFPATFAGNTRKVQLSGEAYFEVAKDAAKPFIAEVGTENAAGYQQVEVLGTQFNIRAYSNEPGIATTLVEGKVKVSTKVENKMLVPGQQTNLNNDGKILLKEHVDVEEITAWHQGLFRFSEMTIQEIMVDAARWYGIEVVYKGSFTEHFNSGIPRQSTLQEFLKILETTGRVKFLIDGKQVTVLPAK